MNGLIERDERLERLHDDADRIARCAETGELTTPIGGCPGWDLRQLVVHTGFVHRWATQALRHVEAPDVATISEPAADASGEELGAWMRLGAGVLADVLAITPLDAPTWHPFPAEQRAWIWLRRQMVETAIHRWDAEAATVGTSALDARLGVMAIDEHLTMLLPRGLDRSGTPAPSSSVHLHCTDAGLPAGAGEWIAWNENGTYRVETEHRKGDAALRGPAADLLLVLMGRIDRSSIEIIGDAAAAAAWIDLQGL